tara:strand:+ start:284 stop:1477 length:1194 start_codon:yes stop_codon:yes gene_type:complete
MSWKVKSWNDVLEIRSGRNQKDVINPEGIYPIIGSAGKVMGYADDYLCEAGTTIIGRKGTINNPLFIEENFWNVDTAFGLQCKEGLNKYFFHYFCLSFDFTEMDKGSGRPSLVKSDLLKIPIPIPPLSEQKQIVALLDQAFVSIDKAKANIEQNIQNAKELFQSKLNEVFSQSGDGWEEKKLIEVNKFIDYRGKTPKKTESGIKLITAKNVRMGYMRNKPEEFIAEADYDEWMTRGIPKKGDVLFTTEAPLANVTLLNTSEKIALAQRIITLCPDRSILSGEYLTYCLQSKIIQNKILEKGTGATVTGIKSRLLKEITIPIPPLTKQDSDVTSLDKFKTQSNTLIKKYNHKLSSLEELKKSILQKAFAGELVSAAQATELKQKVVNMAAEPEVEYKK